MGESQESRLTLILAQLLRARLKAAIEPCYVDWVEHAAARFACENWHYAKCAPKSKIAKLGVWEHGSFRGVVMFGVGATRSLCQRYGLQPEQGCELVRIALREHATPVTRIVRVALKMLHEAYPGLKLVVSFADPEHGHHGGIYQGGNWIYAGRSQSSDEYIYKGKRWQGRSFRNNYKSMEHHPDVQVIKGSSKLSYLMPLTPEVREKVHVLALRYVPRGSFSVKTPAAQVGDAGSTPSPSLHYPRPPELWWPAPFALTQPRLDVRESPFAAELWPSEVVEQLKAAAAKMFNAGKEL